MEHILNNKSAVPCPGEERLAALTAWEREKWAHIRDNVFRQGNSDNETTERFIWLINLLGLNRVSLYTIESAAFVLSLDDEPFEFDINKPEKLDKFGSILLHGKGCDRWFDKSFTVCVGTNGRVMFDDQW